MITEAELAAIQARCDAADTLSSYNKAMTHRDDCVKLLAALREARAKRDDPFEQHNARLAQRVQELATERDALRFDLKAQSEITEEVCKARDALRAETEMLNAECAKAWASDRQAKAEVERLKGEVVSHRKHAAKVAVCAASTDNFWEKRVSTLAEMRDGFRDERDDALAKLSEARAEVERLRLDAGRLADEVAVLVRCKVIDSRSPAADALLDFRDPPSTPRADALAEARAEIERYVYDGARTCTKCEGSGTYSNGALGLVRCKYCDGGSIALYRKRITP